MTTFRVASPVLALVAMLGGCSPSAPEGAANEAAPDGNRSAVVAPAATPAPAATKIATPARILELEGLGDLRLGAPIPKGSDWAERGAQASDTCRTITSPRYPGVYAIVSGGRVRRITVGARSDVKLVEGIGVGSTVKDVRGWFGGFRSEPHAYEPAPAAYLTAPNAASGDPALRFEIGQDNKVSLIHVGMMPELGYVEGCA